METPKLPEASRAELAHIGKSVVIRGEVSGSEDLFLDGQVEGSIELQGNRLTIGPNGRVKANINARSAIVQGRLEGNIHASDRVDLKHSAIMLGDIATQRISIEEGAYYKGGVDIQREAPKPEVKAPGKPEIKAEPRPEARPAPVAAAVGAASVPSLVEPRK